MAPAPEKADSVYDFLYADLPRLQIFNSQFSQYGHITELTRSTSTSSSHGGGFDLKVVKADTSDGEETSVAKKYDTQFISPLTFLDNAKDMIVRDITKAGIGQFVLVSGEMRVLNLTMIRDAWDSKSVQKLMGAGIQQTNNGNISGQERRARREAADQQMSTLELMVDMLRLMPHGLQGQLRAPPNEIWCAMRSEGFITPPSDLLLNHGLKLTGTWNLVGILDATPDTVQVPDTTQGGPAVLNGPHSLVGNLAITLQPIARQMLGRPEGAFGVTPLVVFREVALDK